LCAADQRLVARLHMDTGQPVVSHSGERDRSIMRITPPTQWKLPVTFSDGYPVFSSSRTLSTVRSSCLTLCRDLSAGEDGTRAAWSAGVEPCVVSSGAILAFPGSLTSCDQETRSTVLQFERLSIYAYV
jgi:hypothetical protein